ncbi:MAG: prolipoprotein diacylglyceryl transferase [Alphaproteobacteria bacterium]|nr:prolipoprotein diacylglyceryl transferase [Alphaproteobacteria bacterium]
MVVHLLFDALAWAVAFVIRYLTVRYCAVPVLSLPPKLRWRYALVLLLGAGNGAVLCGSFNLWLQFPNALGHSVLGAIIGGILTVELFKWRFKIKTSTGAVWALPIAVGIAVGRLGCFFSGLEDYTYGVPTTLAWGVDFGDGLTRHPVQLYESLAMLVFVVLALVALRSKRQAYLQAGFYCFALYYGLQRFLWEFLKPYATLAFGLNLFQYLCLALIVYALLMLRKSYVRARP